MKSAFVSTALVVALLFLAAPAHAQYTLLWTIASPDGPAASAFDLGEIGTMTQHGGQGRWLGGPAHSAATLGAPGAGVHASPTAPANTVFGDTDGDGTLEFVSDDGVSALHVWNGAFGVEEAAPIPYPGANYVGCSGVGFVTVLYITLLDVNPGDGAGRAEILIHWICSGIYGTSCYGLLGPGPAPEPAFNGPTGLLQNAPNPFRAATTLRFELAAAGPAKLRVYDPQGRLVRTLSEGRREPGRHDVTWDGRDDDGRAVAAGVYYYELVSDAGKVARKAVRLE